MDMRSMSKDCNCFCCYLQPMVLMETNGYEREEDGSHCLSCMQCRQTPVPHEGPCRSAWKAGARTPWSSTPDTVSPCLHMPRGGDHLSRMRDRARAAEVWRSHTPRNPKSLHLPHAGDHLYRMNYQDFVLKHRKTGADITVAALPSDEKKATAFGLMKINGTGRVCVIQ